MKECAETWDAERASEATRRRRVGKAIVSSRDTHRCLFVREIGMEGRMRDAWGKDIYTSLKKFSLQALRPQHALLLARSDRKTPRDEHKQE